ncbi:hypothetical protein EVAR_31100_1 [Eumeta japonica]|uniref:Uncharacterized protein n=1 Tax=Eumeta variegata TaxID=151549 RepID=A0A4C1VF28_EUMVA|nr:hypothetical protein EVAR_31100_1 [Eumeta japonica]
MIDFEKRELIGESHRINRPIEICIRSDDEVLNVMVVKLVNGTARNSVILLKITCYMDSRAAAGPRPPRDAVFARINQVIIVRDVPSNVALRALAVCSLL